MEVLVAEVSKKRISSLLTTCYICKRTYEKPKVLSCYHTFCESCLRESVPGQGLSLHCVICGHQSILPKDGVKELRKNPYIDRIMQSAADSARHDEDLSNNNVTDVSELHANLASEEDSPVLLETHLKDIAAYNTMKCNSECDGIISVYCKSCDMVICEKCASLEHVEHYDAIKSLESVSSECEEALLKQADTLEQKMSPLQKALQQTKRIFDDLESSRDSSASFINESFDNLQGILNQRREELLGMVEETYETKRVKLTSQMEDIRKYVDRMEEGLDVIVQSLSTKLNVSSKEESELEDLDSQSNSVASDTRAFFLHKQVSKTIDDLCKYKLDTEESNLKKDDSTSTVSEHSVRLTGSHGTQTYQAPIKLTVPSENSHISVVNMQNMTKLEHLISHVGSVETSHAIPQRSVLSGECITTGYCKAGCENRVILTAKTWSGDLETSGKVAATVKMEYIGPNDNDDVVVYRTASPISRPKSSSSHRNTWDGSKSPRSLYSAVPNHSTPIKNGARKSKPNSPAPAGGRSTLKDIFFHSNRDADSSGQTTPSSQEDERTYSPDVRVDYIKNGAYEITFVPKSPGKYQLSVSMYGKELPHGCFVVSAINIRPQGNSRLRNAMKSDSKSIMKTQSVRQKGMKRPPSLGPRKNPIEDDLVLKIGSRGRGKGEFSNPQGVSTDHLGRLLVADSTNQCVQVFSLGTKKTKEPKYLFRFGERGRGSGQVQRPTGVYGLPNGDIAVSDYDNKVVKIFGEDGANKVNVGNGKLMGPKGVCLDRNGHLVVVDNKLCQILVFQLNGRLVTKFGSRGTEAHQLAGPHFVSVNNDNLFYISDFYNHCVKIFTPTGNCIGVIGSTGEGCGQFNAPTGLAIDARGNLIVADWGNSRLQVFDKHGSFLTYINTNEDPLYGPQGVTLIQDEQVAVADSGNQCVKIYRYLQ